MWIVSDSVRGPSETESEEPVDPLRLSTGRLSSRDERPDDDAPVIDPFAAARAEEMANAKARASRAKAIGIAAILALLALGIGALAVSKLSSRSAADEGERATTAPSEAAPIASAPILVVPPDPTPRAIPTPPARGSARAGERVPKTTTTSRIGRIPVIDLGTQETQTLEESLRAQRASAAAESKTVLVMIVRYDFAEQPVLDAAMADPRVQEALADVRIVRVDGRFFAKELAALGFPLQIAPTLCLIGPDLVPRDAIDGREWDDDTPDNIAPVLGAFVRGTYKKRRHAWTPPQSRGVEL